MASISIAAGEEHELIPQGAGGEWELQVTSGQVRLHEVPNLARSDGRLRSPSNGHRLITLEGNDGLYAYAEQDASVEVQQSGFLDIFIGQPVAERPVDRSRRLAGTVGAHSTASVAANGSLDGAWSNTVNEENGIEVESVSWRYDQAAPSEDCFVKVLLKSGGGVPATDDAAFVANGPGSVSFDPGVFIDKGGSIDVNIGFPGSVTGPVDMETAATYTVRGD